MNNEKVFLIYRGGGKNTNYECTGECVVAVS